jgi:predicted DNA repair protein MutK
MFLVGGGILTHGIRPLHHTIEAATAGLAGAPHWLAATLADGLVGIVAGALVLGLVLGVRRVASPLRRSP